MILSILSILFILSKNLRLRLGQALTIMRVGLVEGILRVIV